MSSLREQLQDVYDRRGVLTPAVVLAEARATDHPLHNRFEWDDSIAGERWRVYQAHELIQCVRVTYQETDGTVKSVRAFHCVRGPQGHTYQTADEIIHDPLLTEMVMRDMEREWRSLRDRYDRFDEFRQMITADLVS